MVAERKGVGVGALKGLVPTGPPELTTSPKLAGAPKALVLSSCKNSSH